MDKWWDGGGGGGGEVEREFKKTIFILLVGNFVEFEKNNYK